MNEKGNKQKKLKKISLLNYTEKLCIRHPHSMFSYQSNATDVDTKDTLCINYVQKVFIDKDKFPSKFETHLSIF